MAMVGKIKVTLDVEPPHRVSILTPSPDDPEVKLFLAEFLERLADSSILAGVYEARGIPEIMAAVQDISGRTDQNMVLVVTHGSDDGTFYIHEPAWFDDYPVDLSQLVGSYEFWASIFGGMFSDKLVFLAICHSGSNLRTYPLLHAAMAKHVVTPDPSKPILNAIFGAQAMAAVVNAIAEVGDRALDPNAVESIVEEVRGRHDNAIRLWRYRATPEFVDDMYQALRRWQDAKGR